MAAQYVGIRLVYIFALPYEKLIASYTRYGFKRLSLEEYKENYFGWGYNFELPTTNNESERSLRMTKSKQKNSGQFDDVKNVEDFAAVWIYIETCRRNGKDPYEALYRLMDDNPYAAEELLQNV